MGDDIHIRESIETARGCGYRKKGGIYVMGGNLWGSCGKLPRECDRCPACDHGIKPSRGWTWVDPRHWFEKMECSEAPKGTTCEHCKLGGGLPEKAGILWIGEKFYPTVEKFAAEARTRGISRRIAQIPKELEVGQTLVLLAHRKGMNIPCPECGGKALMPTEFPEFADCPRCNGQPVQVPAIFAAFTPTALEYIVNDNETPDELEAIQKRGCELVRVIESHEAEQGSIEFE